MPASVPRSFGFPAPWLKPLVYTFAVFAAVLWILGAIPPFTAHGHTPFFPVSRNFEDILVYQGRFSLFHTAKFFTSKKLSGFAYPAGCAVIYAAFYAIPNPVRTYLLLAAVVTVIAIALTLFHLRRARLTSLFLPLLLFSFPFVFLVQRANIEIVLFALVAAGILAYRRGWTYAAAILFGLAAACKLYPIFLLGLFLKRRQQLPAFLTGIVTAIVAMCASIAFAGPSFLLAAHGFLTGVGHFQNDYVQTVRSAEINYDHCLFSTVKYWSTFSHASLTPLMHWYYTVAGTLALLLFLRVRTLPFLNRVVFLTTAMVALPPVSYTYTLTHLYLPALLLMVGIARANAPATARLSLATIFFLLLPLVGAATVYPLPAGPIQAVAVLLLLLLPATQPWPTTLPANLD